MSSGSQSWQQILALDARYSAYRMANNASFKTLYMRRRSQLLRDAVKQSADPSIRRQYIRTRNQLLAQRYNVPEVNSLRSRSASVRSSSQSLASVSKQPSIVPTDCATASRALVGDTSLTEHYSFTGVHHVFELHRGAVTRLRWAHDDRSRLCTASTDTNLSICYVDDADANKCGVRARLQGHSMEVTDFAWSVSNDLIVSCSRDCSVRLWNACSGECIRIVTDALPFTCCCFQPLNNNLVVAGSSKVPGAATALCCDSSGKLLWVADDKGNICSLLIDAVTGKLIKGKRTSICPNSPISSLCARAWVSRDHPDTLLLANSRANGLYVLRVSDTAGSVQIGRRFTVTQQDCPLPIRSSFCPLMSFRRGICVLTGSDDTRIYLLDIERTVSTLTPTLQPRLPVVNTLSAHHQAVLDTKLNHDETLLASGDMGGSVIIWKRSK